MGVFFGLNILKSGFRTKYSALKDGHDGHLHSPELLMCTGFSHDFEFVIENERTDGNTGLWIMQKFIQSTWKGTTLDKSHILALGLRLRMSFEYLSFRYHHYGARFPGKTVHCLNYLFVKKSLNHKVTLYFSVMYGVDRRRQKSFEDCCKTTE